MVCKILFDAKQYFSQRTILEIMSILLTQIGDQVWVFRFSIPRVLLYSVSFSIKRKKEGVGQVFTAFVTFQCLLAYQKSTKTEISSFSSELKSQLDAKFPLFLFQEQVDYFLFFSTNIRAILTWSKQTLRSIR